MIRVYKEDLKKDGIYIDIIIGAYGDYGLNQNIHMLIRKFKMQDVCLLNKYIVNEKAKCIR